MLPAPGPVCRQRCYELREKKKMNGPRVRMDRRKTSGLNEKFIHIHGVQQCVAVKHFTEDKINNSGEEVLLKYLD